MCNSAGRWLCCRVFGIHKSVSSAESVFDQGATILTVSSPQPIPRTRLETPTPVFSCIWLSARNLLLIHAIEASRLFYTQTYFVMFVAITAVISC